MTTARGKLIHLECARGIASIIVIFHHFTLAFYPHIRLNFYDGGIRWTPLYVFINGSAAVTFFFVLSGFVLTHNLFNNPSPRALATSIVKRLPRLMAPASASIFVGLVILLYCGNQYKIAADISHSEWLKDFGNAHLPIDAHLSAIDAAKQSLYVFLLPDRFYYNSNLWTMVNEYYGSMLTFFIVSLYTINVRALSNKMILIHAILIAIFSILHNAFVPFVVGSLISYLVMGRDVGRYLSAKATVLLICAIVFGFSGDNWLQNTIASLCVMLLLLGSRDLARRLSGRLGHLVGTLSFPLYLVHTLVILSLSSYAYIYLSATPWSHPYCLPILLIFTIVASLVFCIPFVYLDNFWTRWLNIKAKSTVSFLASVVSNDKRYGRNAPLSGS